MNDTLIEKKLKSLKVIEPNMSTLKQMKGNIDKRIIREHENTNNRRIRVMWGSLAIILIIGTLLFAQLIFKPLFIHSLVLYTRISFAANQYDKAQIALTDTTSRYTANTAVNESSVQDIAYSLNVTNDQMSKLKLKGETGKYSAKQCQELYQHYLLYLNQEYGNVPQNLSNLRTQIANEREEAEMRLHMYDKL